MAIIYGSKVSVAWLAVVAVDEHGKESGAVLQVGKSCMDGRKSKPDSGFRMYESGFWV